MDFSCLIFALMVMGVCGPGLAQELPTRFVVKDVRYAQPPRVDFGFRWELPQPVLDLDGDGLPEYAFVGSYQNFLPSGQVDAVWKLHRGGSGKLLWSKIFDQYVSFFSYSAAKKGKVLLKGPNGIGAVRVSADEEHLGIFPPPIGSKVKWIPIPEVVPGAMYNWVWNVSPAGDVNKDGSDDFLYEGVGLDRNSNAFFVIGVFDGLLMEPMWLVVQSPASELSTLMFSWWSRYPRFEDLNGDGFLDVVVYWIPRAGLPHVEIRALSGRDGSILWQHYFPRPQYIVGGTVRILPVGDLDQDGLRDILGYTFPDPFQGEPGYLRAVSGATGNQLWETTAEDFDPNYSLNPPESSALGVLREWPDVNGDGIPEFSSSATYTPNSNFLSEFWIMDGATTHFLQIMELDFDTLAPWSTVTVPAITGMLMGRIDLDDDGWPEGYVEVNVDPGVAYPGAHQATVGVESLRLPETVQTGVPISCKIHIPSSPGKDFRLLFSKSFKPGAAAHHIGSWNTTLKLDATSKQMNGVAGTTSTLDTHGWYSGTFTLPAGVGLENSTIYVRGIILDPTKLSGVKTLTTLSTLTVL
jgi:hypothetical protein